MPAHYDYLLSLLLRCIGGVPPTRTISPAFSLIASSRFRFSDCEATAAAAVYMPPPDFEEVGCISSVANPPALYVAIFKAAARTASVA